MKRIICFFVILSVFCISGCKMEKNQSGMQSMTQAHHTVTQKEEETKNKSTKEKSEEQIANEESGTISRTEEPEKNTELTTKNLKTKQTRIRYVEGNPYFPVPQNQKSYQKSYSGWFLYYGGDYSEAKRNVTMKFKFLNESQYGTLYHISFNRIKGENIPKEDSNLGYFFVKKDRIYRMKKLSDSEKNILIKMGTLPKDASIVCQEKEMKKDLGQDPNLNNPEVIWHEKIERKKNRIRYCRYWTGTPTIHGEHMGWEKGYGLIYYYIGYEAGVEATYIIDDDKLDYPNDFW